MSNSEIKNLYLDSYRRDNFFIGGEWVKPDSKIVIEIISPSTEEQIGQVPDANTADIDLAVKAASAAFAKKNSWSTWPVAERTKVMRKFADILEVKHQELSILYAHELGRPYKPTVSRPSRPTELLRYYADLAEQMELDQMRLIPARQNPGSVKRSSVKLESRGVTAVIVPYNGTLEMGMFKIGPTWHLAAQ